MTVATVVFLVITFFPRPQKSQTLNGSVVFDGSIKLSYSKSQIPDSNEDRMSPMSGTLLRHLFHGVMFFAKNFDIYAEDHAPKAKYFAFQIISPYYYMDIEPRFEFDYTLIKTKKDNFYKLINYLKQDSVSKDSLSANDLYKNAGVDTVFIKRKVQIVSVFNTTGKMGVYSLGNNTAATLLPMKNSEVEINKYRDTYLHEYNAYAISETFDTRDPKSPTVDMPMIDILGPYNLIVTDCNYISTNAKIEKAYTDSNEVCCLLLKSGLANRISYGQLRQSSVDDLFNQSIAGMYTENLGLFHLTINTPLTDSEYSTMRRKMYASTTHYEASVPKYITTLFPPPLPDENGIHFYGHNLSKLECLETYGSIEFGKKSYSFDPFKSISMKNLDSFEFYDQPVIFPLNYDAASNYKTKFRGTGKLFIDGDYQGENILDEPYLLKISFIIGLVTGIISLGGFAKVFIEGFTNAHNIVKKDTRNVEVVKNEIE